jgi:hypothetical protein
MRNIFTLTDYIVEKRPDGWYFSTYQRRRDRKSFQGPYNSDASVALMIARQLRKEIRRRQQHAAA